MSEITLQEALESLKEYADRHGWTIDRERAIPHGYQLWVTDGQAVVPVVLYATGKVLIQGKPSHLQQALQLWCEARSLPAQASAGAQPPRASGSARIGLDEAGKGDYFGPLVVGAVYVDAAREEELLALGIRDSKLLSDARMEQIAKQIRSACPHAVVRLGPERYNQLYERFRNLDRLLAWGHSQALRQVLEQTGCKQAIADQFARRSVLEEALREQGLTIDLEQRPRAESDIAVAAASILARVVFVHWMDHVSQRLGRRLPKGGSDPAIVEVGRLLVAQGGRDLLTKVAKLHFRTTGAIFAA